MKLLSILVLLHTSLVLMVALPAPSFGAAEAGRAVLVLDASGSMQAQVGGVTKMETAKTVVRNMLDTWNPGIELGLVVYGHRFADNCTDIGTLIPVGPLDNKSFAVAVESIQPKGMTPLSSALLQAAELLRYTETKATVILVSDGQETCGRDPCAVARQLEETGMDFTAHVIGFDLGQVENPASLQCMASETGGLFLMADDAESLQKALFKTAEQAAQPENGIQLVAVEDGSDSPTEIDRWEIFRLSETAEPERVFYSFNDTPRLHLPAGRYLASVTKAQVKGSAEFQATGGENQTVEVTLARQGNIKIRVVSEPDGEPLEDIDMWEIFPLGTTEPKRVAYGLNNGHEETVLAGSYLVKAKLDQAKSQTKVTVKPGGTVTAEVVLPLQGRVRIMAMHEPGGPAMPIISRWEIFTVPSPSSGGKPERVEYGFKNGQEKRLLPGQYRIHMVYEQAEAWDDITILPGKETTAEIVLPLQGTLRLMAVKESSGAELAKGNKWEVFAKAPAGSGDKPKLLAYGFNSPGEFILLPGEYGIRLTRGNASWSKQVEILANKTSVVSFPIGTE